MDVAPNAGIKVSVVMCTRNRADQLAVCLDHFAAVQSSVPWELVVLDNGSDDATPEILRRFAQSRSFAVKILTDPTRGLGRARNAAWQASSGDIVAFTDDDCYVAADYIEAIARAFALNERVGYVGGRILLHDKNDAPVTIEESTEEQFFPPYTLLRTGSFQGANMIVRRCALEAIAGFDESFGYGTPFPASDIEAITRVSFSGWAGLYDPRIVVRHHHMRKPADIPELHRRYARGRGAYWAKFLLIPATRTRTCRQWGRRLLDHYRDTGERTQCIEEFRGAAAYLKRHGIKYLFAPPPAARLARRRH